MHTRMIAFLGFAFVLYWLLAGEPQPNRRPELGPVKPSLTQVLNPPYVVDSEPMQQIRTPAAKRSEIPLRQWIKAEATKVGRIDSGPQNTLTRLRQRARTLKTADFELLKSWALNPTINSEERFLSVYMIGLGGAKLGLGQLKAISLAEIPNTTTERLRSDEILVRAQAIETLVQKLDSAEAKRVLLQILGRTSDPILARHVQYWLNTLT